MPSLTFYCFESLKFRKPITSYLFLAASDDKIVGGTVSAAHAAPFIANIKRSGSLMCGGSLVSTGYVVSAAHCEYKYVNRKILSGIRNDISLLILYDSILGIFGGSLLQLCSCWRYFEKCLSHLNKHSKIL